MKVSTKNYSSTRRAGALSLVVPSLLLSACAPEAPPCNGAEVTRSMQQLVTKAHDDNLKATGYKVADLATITLDAPEVTAYDDKLKTRSCKVTYDVQVRNDRVAPMVRYMAAMESPVMDFVGNMAGLTAALGGPDQRKELAQQQSDVAAFQLWNQGPLTSDPVRKTVSYRIQKEEGGKDYVVRTNVDVNGSIQYLRIAAQTDLQLKREAKQTKAAAAPTHQSAPTQAAPSQAAQQEEDAKLQQVADMIAAGNPNRGADTPPTAPAQAAGAASASAAPATAPKPSGPENLMSQVTRYDMCGEEAMCLYTAKGNTVRMNAFGLSDGDRFLLAHSVKNHQPVCLKKLERTQGREFTAEAIGSEC